MASKKNEQSGAPATFTHVNTVLIIGEAARDAALNESPDGRVFTSFDVVCRVDGERTVVPVTWEGETAVTAGQLVAVVGRVNKRFFSAGGGLASRTDVRAEKVTIVRRRDQLNRVVDAVVAGLSAE